MNMREKFQAIPVRGKTFALTALGLMSVGYVCVNALYLQDGSHPSALFSMRDRIATQTALQSDELALPPARTVEVAASQGLNKTRILLDKTSGSSKSARLPEANTQTEALPELPKPSVAVRSLTPEHKNPGEPAELANLQEMLAKLGFYEGKIDGIMGSRTRKAIETYKASVGLQDITLSNGQLVASARNNLLVTAAIPATRPANIATVKTKTVSFTPPQTTARPAEQSPSVSEDVVRQVQQGLKDFTGGDMAVDGAFGSQTANAISEFQALFRLPVTGKIDADLLTKMQAVGLLN